MQNNDNNPDVASTICSRLMSWRAHQPPGDLEFVNGELRQMLELQGRLGWEAAFTGCWAQGWAKEQDDWHHFEQSSFAGKQWLAAIIKKLWDAAWDM
jgi:hypothetical protein